MSDRARGWLIGLILPPVVFFLTLAAVSVRYEVEFGRTLRFAQDNDLLAPLLALAVMPNLVVFLRRIHTRIEQARGVLMATMVWGLVVVIVKYAF